MDNVMLLQEKLIEALVAAKSAEKIAERALSIAVQALSKVRGMEKSTHKVITVNNQPAPFDPLANNVSYSPPSTTSTSEGSQQSLEEQLNQLLGTDDNLIPGDVMEALP